jgi:CRP-like cAMP-binding protein
MRNPPVGRERVLTPEALMQSHHLLSALTQAERQRLLALASVKRYRPGEMVFAKGDAGDGLYGVLDGQIAITADSPEGRELILNLCEPGSFFGEVALLDGQGRSANALAKLPTSLLFVGRRAFMPYLESNPKIAIRLLAILCERLRVSTERFEDSMFLGVPARLAKRLLALVDAHGRPADAAEADAGLKLSQGELARILGVSREIVNRQLSEWRDAGIILTRGGRIAVKDRKSLERYFEER